MYILKKHRFGQFCVCVCWVDYNSLSHREPLAYSLLPQTPKQHSGPLESTLGLDELCLWHRVISTRIWLHSKDNICQSSLVSNLYCLLHSAASTFFFLQQRWGFRFNLKIPVKSPFMFLISLKCSKAAVSVFNQAAQLCKEWKKACINFSSASYGSNNFLPVFFETWRVSTLHVNPMQSGFENNCGPHWKINISPSFKFLFKNKKKKLPAGWKKLIAFHGNSRFRGHLSSCSK